MYCNTSDMYCHTSKSSTSHCCVGRPLQASVVLSAQDVGNMEVAWVTAQIHGHILFDVSKHPPFTDVLASHHKQAEWQECFQQRQLAAGGAGAQATHSSKREEGFPNFKEYGGRNSICILASEPRVLFAKKCVSNNRLEILQLQSMLPKVLPPSYRGSALRILYILSVSAKQGQQLGSNYNNSDNEDGECRTVHLPFAVLAAPADEHEFLKLPKPAAMLLAQQPQQQQQQASAQKKLHFEDGDEHTTEVKQQAEIALPPLPPQPKISPYLPCQACVMESVHAIQEVTRTLFF